MTNTLTAIGLTLGLSVLSSSALADEELGFCTDWLNGADNGRDAQSCTPSLMEHYAGLESETEKLRLSMAAEQRGIDLSPAMEASDGDVSQTTFGHVTLINPPDNAVPVDGPSLEETLAYIARITNESDVVYYSSLAGSQTGTATIEYSLNGCWFEFERTAYCGESVWSKRSHGFDLSEADVRVAELGSNDARLLRPDRLFYPENTIVFGQCSRNGEFTRFNQPEESRDYDTFYINTWTMIRDRRKDYARQMQNSLLHLAHMCGAAEEQLLFD